MMTTLQRLVSYPHAAVFDKAPLDELVFRLRHTAGATWTIADAVMTTRAGVVETVYHLENLTVASLASALTGHGYQVTELSSAFSHLSALVLVEGSGDQGTSNGDRVTGYTSLMWALMGGYAGEVRAAREQVIQALRQMVITQAEGEWLDVWGTLYGVPRPSGMSDADYQALIPREAFRVRLNKYAIEDAVKDATGYDVVIHEPWQDMFNLNTSMLNGPDKLQSIDEYNFNIIKPIGLPGTDWNAVLPVIERNRSAGVRVFQPSYDIPVTHAIYPFDEIQVSSCIVSTSCAYTIYEDTPLLNSMLIEDVGLLNYPALFTRKRRRVSESVLDQYMVWTDLPWSERPWDTPSTITCSYWYRNYRSFSLSLEYASQPWTAAKTWDTADTWADIGPFTSSTFTRTP